MENISTGRKKILFSLFPASGINIASPRIRVYTLQRALEKMGFATTLGYSFKADVLFFQKKLTAKHIWLARLAKLMGKKIVYDVDDLGKALWRCVKKSNFVKMLSLADIVTTCSQGQCEFLVRTYGLNNCHVIYNAIDYFPQGPVKFFHQRKDPLRIVWFGSNSNIGLLEKYLPVLSQIPNSEIYAIVGNRPVTEISQKFPKVQFLRWSLSSMITDLQSCDITCLMHDGSEEDRAKGNNKMITAITWGVPAVVSATPEYARTAKESGIEYAVFSDENDLPAVIERLRSPAARNRYLEVAQEVIWERYSPEAIAKEYVKLIFQEKAQD